MGTNNLPLGLCLGDRREESLSRQVGYGTRDIGGRAGRHHPESMNFEGRKRGYACVYAVLRFRLHLIAIPGHQIGLEISQLILCQKKDLGG